MDLIIAFLLFTAAMITTLITGHTMLLALAAGLAAFLVVGLRRGYRLKGMLREGLRSVRSAMIVIVIMLIIGAITGGWRISGTISIFVYYGMKVIQPKLFLLIAFLLTCLLSYALGTSFGVAGTVGVIFMTLARSGGVDPIVTAGVIMSGVYFGDRCSPVSSSAHLVCGVTGTEIYRNVRLMFRTAVLPFVLTLAVYSVLSVKNPIQNVDQDVLRTFRETFPITPWALVPAALMLILPLLRVNVIYAMLSSIAASVVVACVALGEPLLRVLKVLLVGVKEPGSGLVTILNGGGVLSMVEVSAILALSGMYSGIFEHTKMLEGVQQSIGGLCDRIGRYPVCFLTSLATAMVFCNQTISTLIVADLLKRPYQLTGGDHQELAIDMENSVILLSCLVPWCIGFIVPMEFMGTDFTCIPYACYMYLVPLTYFFVKGRMKEWKK